MIKTRLPHELRRARRTAIHILALLPFLLTARTPAYAAGQAETNPDWMDLAHKLDSSQKKDRIAAVQAAAVLGHEGAAAYLRPILTGDDDREVRLETVKALGAIPGAGAVTVLGEGLSDGDLRVRKATVEALRRRPEDSALDQLTRALQDKKSELRAAALLALGSRLDSGRAGLLAPGLTDRDSTVREAAIYALGATGGESAIEALAEVVAGEDNKKIKALAAEVLGMMGSRRAIPALVAARDSADKDVLLPSLESAIKSILVQTPIRVKEELARAQREVPPPAPEAPVTERPAKPAEAVPAGTASAPVPPVNAPAAAPSLPSPQPVQATTPVPGRAKAKPVVFKLKAEKSGQVLLTGPVVAGKRKIMVRSVDGTWSASMPLAPGSYRYFFLVDGQKTLDPDNTTIEKGASVMTVH